MVLICSYPMTCEMEHLFICLLAICISSVGEVSVQIFNPFLNLVVQVLIV